MKGADDLRRGSAGLAEADRFTFVAGIVGIVLILGFVVSNFGLADVPNWPANDATADELADFFSTRAGKLQWEAGLRFMELFLLPFFAIGVARHVRGNRTDTRMLAAVALIGQVWLMATGLAANSFESVLIFQADELSAEPEFARAMFLSMTVLFAIAVLPWALTILCFSEAGRRTRTLPRSIWLVGYVQAATGVISGAMLTQTLEDNLAAAAGFVAFLAFALWVLLVAIHLLRSSRWRHLHRVSRAQASSGGATP